MSKPFVFIACTLGLCLPACSDPGGNGSSTTNSGGAGGAGGASGSSSSSSGGGGMVNLACGDDPTLSAAEKQLIDMPADSWLEVPNTHFADFCKNNEPPGAHTVMGCPAIILAWGGGTYDPVHRKMILWGGGHNDYWGNEVYGFSLKTSAWELLLPGTSVESAAAISEPMADGNPVSRHSYDGLAYLTAENRFFGFGGAAAPNGYSSTLTWSLDIDAKKWTQLDPQKTLPSNPDGYYWMGTAYDEAGHRVFMRNEDGVYVFDIAANKWTLVVDAGFPPLYPTWQISAYRRGVYDSKRKIFFTLGGKHADGKPDFFAFDATAMKPVYDDWVTSGGDDIAGAGGPGADYDPVTDSIVAWSGGPARVLDLATKMWTTKSGNGAPMTPVGNGTYGRFRYISQYNVFILVNQPDQNVYFYKHSAGCGP